MTTQDTALPDVRVHRPLGYWLKSVDRSIEEGFARLLADENLTRRGWQVLNTVSYAPVTVAGVDETMAAFLSPAEPTMRPYVEALTARDWAAPTAGATDTFELTEAGRAAHRRISGRIGAERARMMECLTPDEYGVLMDLLQRLATHLDA
ncbi:MULTISPECIES: hypothetical protein [Streptomyces]|uniref:MarR family winged helix-turn-helix transcriptional regulator n=1 Tax=Streptomyces luteosporeus TaxID=173856 RepID=A0ABP6G493_9ACTN